MGIEHRPQDQHRATTPTARQSMHTTLYIPGRGILSTGDILLLKHPVGKAPRSLQTLLPENMAYGVRNITNEGGTREAMTWHMAADDGESSITAADRRKFPLDIVAMNREASRNGHIKAGSHYEHRHSAPLYMHPPPSIRATIKAQAQALSPENLRPSGLPSPRDTTNMHGIMSHRYGEIAAEKMKVDHELRQKQLEKLIPPHKRRDKNKVYTKKLPPIEEKHKSHATNPKEFVTLDVHDLWKIQDYRNAPHKVITHRTADEEARILAQRNQIRI